jgi:hypothetical protein
MLTHRLVVLVDDDRYDRLRRDAERRSVSVASVVRDLIDDRYGASRLTPEDGLRRILEAAPMHLPDVAGLRAELADARGGAA